MPGVWVTPKGQVFECGPADLQHFHNRTKAMLSNGAAIPWTFEHQQDDPNDPIGLSASDLLARWAQNTGGHIHDSRIKNGILELLLDVDEGNPDSHGKTDRQKLESIKYVSPDIRQNWRDRHGPASDEIGPFWPGQSFAHIAITPLPVQYPQKAFSFDKSKMVSLSAADVNVSLSSAVLQPISLSAKDNPMAKKPGEEETPAAPDATGGATPPDAGADSAIPPPTDNPSIGEDLEGGGPITDSEDAGADAALMQSLATEMTALGVEMHSSPDMDLKSFVEHLITAIKTHKSTKALPGEDAALNEEPDADANETTNPMGAEVPQSPPIMMSASTPYSPREVALAKKLVKNTNNSLRQRIGVLRKHGYIDDKIKTSLESEITTTRLSMSDLTAAGALRPTMVSVKVEAYEALAKSGKPGSFTKPATRQTPARGTNPLKPISSNVALSGATEGDNEQVSEAPYGGDEATETRPIVPAVVERLSQGAWKRQGVAQ